ncbi:MAG: hypothetical protein MJ221_01915 [Bacilli bacterium]|nr:hypothetical protein [Bacilli bacterium]
MKTFQIEYTLNGQTYAEHIIAYSKEDASRTFSLKHPDDGASIKSIIELQTI